MTSFQRRLAASTPTVAAGAAELNVTPVLSMFTILIPFLVSMTAFSQLAVQAFELPGNEAAGHAQTLDRLPLTVALSVDRITLVHGDRVLATIPLGDGSDEVTVLRALREAREALPRKSRVVLAVDDAVKCADVVACLDRCREAGFVDVGLAAGPGR